jgi:hypothetical protein
MMIIAVHLFAMRASDRRDGHLGENTVHSPFMRSSWVVTLR